MGKDEHWEEVERSRRRGGEDRDRRIRRVLPRRSMWLSHAHDLSLSAVSLLVSASPRPWLVASFQSNHLLSFIGNETRCMDKKERDMWGRTGSQINQITHVTPSAATNWTDSSAQCSFRKDRKRRGGVRTITDHTPKWIYRHRRLSVSSALCPSALRPYTWYRLAVCTCRLRV